MRSKALAEVDKFRLALALDEALAAQQAVPRGVTRHCSLAARCTRPSALGGIDAVCCYCRLARHLDFTGLFPEAISASPWLSE